MCIAMKLLAFRELGPVKGIDYSKSQIYRKIRDGTFVRPVRLGANKIAFVEAEIDAWIEQRIAERNHTTSNK